MSLTPYFPLTAKGTVLEESETEGHEPNWLLLSEKRFFREASSWWDELVRQASARGPFLRLDWLALWWKAFGHGRTLSVLADDGAGVPRWALPLHMGRERMAGIPVTTFRLMTNAHSGPADVILSTPTVAGEAARGIASMLRVLDGWDVLVLEHIPEHSPLTKWFNGFPSFLRRTLLSPYVQLQSDFEGLLRARSRHFRQLLRRKMRKALNTPGFEIHRAVKPSDGAAFWEAVESVDAASWKAKAGTAITLSPEQRVFYRGLVDLALENGWSFLAWATHKGVPVAYEIAIRYGDTVHSLKIAFDQRYGWLSPGVVLKAWVMQKACEEGLREQDLMGHDEPWKRSYTDLARQHVTLYVFNPESWRGVFLHRLLFLPRAWLRTNRFSRAILDWCPVRKLIRRAGLA